MRLLKRKSWEKYLKYCILGIFLQFIDVQVFGWLNRKSKDCSYFRQFVDIPSCIGVRYCWATRGEERWRNLLLKFVAKTALTTRYFTLFKPTFAYIGHKTNNFISLQGYVRNIHQDQVSVALEHEWVEKLNDRAWHLRSNHYILIILKYLFSS